jgi:hypothetical protein
MSLISRKKFIVSLAGASCLVTLPQVLISQMQPTPSQPARYPKGPELNKALVKEFVGVAHKDFDKIKTMLQETPDLLNAVNNLGGWDWEDAIGAAGHVAFAIWPCFYASKEQGLQSVWPPCWANWSW